MVRPEERIPAATSCHLFLPALQELTQRGDVGLCELPLLAVAVVDLQMVEGEGLRELVVARCRVVDAVLDRGRAHLADRDHIVDARVVYQLLDILMHVRAVRIEPPAVALLVVLEDGRLRDEVHDVEAEARDALVLPELYDVDELGPHLGVVPVEVCLALVEEVQVPLVEGRHIFPGRATELRDPVRRRIAGILLGRIRCCVDELVVGEVLRISCKRFLQPGMARRGVVEDHVEHEAKMVLLRLGDKLVEVCHRAEHRLHGAVVCDIVAVVVLRGYEEWREPEIVDAELLEVVEALRDALEISYAIRIRIVEAAHVYLIDDLVAELLCAVLHGLPLFLEGRQGDPACLLLSLST
jgi:predicted nucleic acid-binding protein